MLEARRLRNVLIEVCRNLDLSTTGVPFGGGGSAGVSGERRSSVPHTPLRTAQLPVSRLQLVEAGRGRAKRPRATLVRRDGRRTGLDNRRRESVGRAQRAALLALPAVREGSFRSADGQGMALAPGLLGGVHGTPTQSSSPNITASDHAKAGRPAVAPISFTPAAHREGERPWTRPPRAETVRPSRGRSTGRGAGNRLGGEMSDLCSSRPRRCRVAGEK